MTEHAFVRAVHRKLDPRIKVWKIIDDYHGGVSDALYFGTGGRHLFVEYKYTKKLPVRPTTLVDKSKLPPLQQDWFRDLKERGQPVCAVIGCGEPRKYKGVWIDEPEECVTGIQNEVFLQRLLSLQEICHRIERNLLGDNDE